MLYQVAKEFEVFISTDGKVFTSAAHSTKFDIDLAIGKVSEAFQSWEKHLRRRSYFIEQIYSGS